MRRYLGILFLLLTLSAPSPADPFDLAVVPIQPARGYDPLLALSFAELVRHDLERMGAIRVLPLRETQEVLGEHPDGVENTDTSSLLAMGRQLHVSWVVGGLIGMAGPLPDQESYLYGQAVSCRLILHLIDVSKGKAVFSFQRTFLRFEDPLTLAPYAAATLVRTMGREPGSLDPPPVSWEGLPQPPPASLIHPKTGIPFILVQPGTYVRGGRMGQGQTGNYATPRHTVRIEKPFYLARCEVTCEELHPFLDAIGFAGHLSEDPTPALLNGLQAKAFCQWAGFRLPSEAEWEYACRADSTTGVFSGEASPDLSRYAWTSQNSEGRCRPVGQLSPNPWGFYDMLGNAFEWCEDRWHMSYHDAPEDQDPWIRNGVPTQWVIRGGDCRTDDHSCRPFLRLPGQVLTPTDKTGIRPVLDVPT